MDTGIARARLGLVMAENRSEPPTPLAPLAVAERRTSPRVPIDRPVRIGPPGGYPHAAVSARDLSEGGLFIDAERMVQVGAKFSVAVPLRSGHDAYVSEAEVTDNRARGAERGFGVRFVRMSSDARELLQAEVEQRVAVTLRNISGDDEPQGFDVGDLPSVPLPGPEPLGFDAEVTEANRAMASVLPSVAPDAGAPTALVRARTNWTKMKAWLRSLPVVSWSVYGLAALAVVVVGGLVVLDAQRLEAPVVAPMAEEVAPELHEQLVEGKVSRGLETAPPVQRGQDIVNPLPERSSARPSPSAPESKMRAASTVVVSAPEPALKKPAAAKARPAAAHPPRGGRTTFLTVPVGAKAKLRKSYVLTRPDRFVVDVVGLDTPPSLPEGSGAVVRLRFGRHDGFGRIVVDARRPIKKGEARIEGGQLDLSLSF